MLKERERDIYIYNEYNQRPGAHLETSLPHEAATPSRGPRSTPVSPSLIFSRLFWDLCRLRLPFGIHFGIFLVFLGIRVLAMFLDQFCFWMCMDLGSFNAYDDYFPKIKPSTVESHRFANYLENQWFVHAFWHCFGIIFLVFPCLRFERFLGCYLLWLQVIW